jgi:hypothetical protein
MSQESHPALAGAIPSFEMFMSQWEALAENPNNLSRMKAHIKKGLAVTYEHYKWMDHTKVFIIAMRR